MNGGAHTLAGVATGIGISYFGDLSFSEGAIVTTVTTVAALAPDLDTTGTLAMRLTKPFRIITGILFSILFSIFITLFFQSKNPLNFVDIDKEILIGAGGVLLALFLIRRIPIKIQLLIMAVGIGLVGYHFDYESIIWFAVFAGISVFLPHRSYTHSVLGLVFFGYISHLASIDLGLPLVFWGGVLGYISHLLLDCRFIPGNRMGIKPLLPLPKPVI